MSDLVDLYAAAPSAAGGGAYAGQGFGPFCRVKRPGGRGDIRGYEAWMSFMVRIEESADALTVIGGLEETITVLGQSVTRVIPLQHPRFDTLYAQQVDWEDFGESGDPDDGYYGGFTHTLINVHFKSLPYATTGNNAYLEFRGNVGPRTERVPASGATIGGNPSPFDSDQYVGGADFEIVIHGLSAFNYPYYLARQNRVNDDVWSFLGFSYPAESLLFIGPSWHLQRNVGNVETWQAGLAFKATTSDFLWNRARDADGAIGVELVNGSKKYPLLDFDELAGT